MSVGTTEFKRSYANPGNVYQSRAHTYRGVVMLIITGLLKEQQQQLLQGVTAVYVGGIASANQNQVSGLEFFPTLWIVI